MKQITGITSTPIAKMRDGKLIPACNIILTTGILFRADPEPGQEGEHSVKDETITGFTINACDMQRLISFLADAAESSHKDFSGVVVMAEGGDGAFAGNHVEETIQGGPVVG